jgi:hypothetical protein
VGEVLSKGRAYVADFEQRFSLLVAEEHYTQEVREDVDSGGGNLSRSNPGGGFSAPSKRGERRVLRSDYLLVRLSDGGWMPFRDVFEVDSRKVRDREERLAALFLKPSDSTLSQAMRIMQDSTRHNLGNLVRTTNKPVLALMLLHESVTHRFVFVAGEKETVV